jgi:transcriptional regulator with XRE-family HTH domain
MAKLQASNIKRLREAKGWSQSILAERAILDPKTLSKALNGNDCQMKTVRKLAAALGVEPGAILDAIPEGSIPETPTDHAEAAPGIDQRVVEVQLVLKLPVETVQDAGSITKVIEAIALLIDAKNPIRTISVSAGSVVLRLELSAEGAVSLVRAAMQRKLKDIHFFSLKVLDEDFPLPDGLPHSVTPFTARSSDAKKQSGNRRKLGREKKRRNSSKRKQQDP